MTLSRQNSRIPQVTFPSLKRLIPLLAFLFKATVQGATLMPANSTSEDIQAALDRLPGGGEVDLAPGLYTIHQPIVLRRDNLTLRGGGVNTILRLADHANCPVIILGAPLIQPRQLTAHVCVADLFIDGNRTNQQVELWRSAMDGAQLNNNGIDVWNVNDAAVENVVCCRCRSGGLVTAETRRLKVSDYTAFDNHFDGLACYQTEESSFNRLHLHDNICAGISLDLAFNHNVIDDAELTGNNLGVFMRDSRDNVFKGVKISKSQRHGVFMAQAAVRGTECTGNSFDGLAISNSGGKAFVVNNASCKNNTIRNARFLDNVLGGLSETEGKATGVSLTFAEPQFVEPKMIAKAEVQTIQTRHEDVVTSAPKIDPPVKIRPVETSVAMP